MRSRYHIHEPEPAHFVTIVEWLPIFTSTTCCDILVRSLEYCRTHKDPKIHAWVILDNHFHAILAASDLSAVLRDFKSYTAKLLVAQLLCLAGTLIEHRGQIHHLPDHLRLLLQMPRGIDLVRQRRDPGDQSPPVRRVRPQPLQGGEKLLRLGDDFIHRHPLHAQLLQPRLKLLQKLADDRGNRSIGLPEIRVVVERSRSFSRRERMSSM